MNCVALTFIHFDISHPPPKKNQQQKNPQKHRLLVFPITTSFPLKLQVTTSYKYPEVLY